MGGKPRQKRHVALDVLDLGRTGVVKVSMETPIGVPITAFRITKGSWTRVGRHPKKGGLKRLVLTVDYIDET